MNIVQTYFDAMADQGVSKVKAIAILNAKLNRHYNHSRMAEFACGTREPPAVMVRYMVRKSLRWVLKLAPGKWSDNQMADALTAEPLDE